MRRRTIFLGLILIVILVILNVQATSGFAQGAPAKPGGARPTNQLMVKFASEAAEAAMLDGAEAAGGAVLNELSQAAGQELTYIRPMSGGAHVVALAEPLPAAEVAAIGDLLEGLPEVAYAEPDLIKTIDGPAALAPGAADINPNDTRFGEQWHYLYTANTAEGLNLPAAWNISTGSAATVVAVIDTGILNHPDLAGRTVPGYDFINDVDTANDGDGRDSDPSDPGDWVTFGECYLFSPARNSSWHGTHVAGTIGAASNNALGVAGVNWKAKILPLRVLGKCGGYNTDIIDAVRWAAGLPVPGVPNNPNPADVINLSLGGPGPCEALEQQAYNDARAAGATVVIAAGNDNDNAAGYSPANCNNTITVAATDRGGDKATYSNYGSIIEVSAPGGETAGNLSNGVLSTLNRGTTTPGNLPSDYYYAFYQGTSMATPHVAGLASLIIGYDPSLTPSQVLAVLQDNARPFPAGSGCTTSDCGAGIVDAWASLKAIAYSKFVLLPLMMVTGQTSTVSFSGNSYSVDEGAGKVTLTIELSSAAAQSVSVGYATVAGTAKAGSDYQYKAARATFLPGQTRKNVSINIIDDASQEANESFQVRLQDPQGTTIVAPSQATVQIIDDDDPAPGLVNGDFEAGSTGWTEFSSNGYPLIWHADDLPVGVAPHSGNWAAWLGGAPSETSIIEQTVKIPISKPYLTYWHWIASQDTCGNDFARVVLDGSITAEQYNLCDSANTHGWVKHSLDLSSWAGPTRALQIRVETNGGSKNSNLFVDDVAFSASPAGAADEPEPDGQPEIPGEKPDAPDFGREPDPAGAK